MEEKEFSEPHYQQRVRQQSSVPFLWEEKPGTPKKEWKPEAVLPVKTVQPPLKLVASVPFKWEEKPGKPLPIFSQSLPDSPLVPLPLTNLTGNDDEEDEEEGMFELDFEAFGFDTDDSFNSAPSLLANRLISSLTISNAVPVQQPFMKSPSTPDSETESNSSSYATGSTSLAGASFLECLFPLFSPDSGFLDRFGFPEKDSCPTPPELQTKEFAYEGNGSIVTRRAPTLGELILMSRRRSYRKKAVHTRKKSLSMERAFGCCIFGTGGTGIDRLQRRRGRQTLKLV